MPVHEENGGYRWGTHGKLYKGPGARAKAERQGQAIEADKARRGKLSKTWFGPRSGH